MPLAHGLGGVSDLPIPLWLAMYAGAVVVIASFFVLGALWTTPKLRGAEAGLPLPRVEAIADSRITTGVLRAIGLLLLAAFLVIAWFGPEDGGRQNPAPSWIYVWFWVGLVPLSLLFGPVWRRINPLRALAGLVRAVLRLRARPLPARVAYWPAVVSLLAFLWLELVSDNAASPRAVAIFVTAYVVVHVAAGAVYGSEWSARGDGFEVYAWMISRASPLGRRGDGRIVLRNPLDGLAATPRTPSLVPVVTVVLGSTVFDGLSRTSLWSDLIAGTDRFAYLAFGTVGLAAAIAAVVLTYSFAIMLTRPYASDQDDLAGVFAHSLIPIAIGYTVAHYFSFALFQGQQGLILTNDPFGQGWNLLGLAGAEVNYLLISPIVIAVVQTAAIVVGHVVAITSAHDQSVAIMRERHVRAGQYPMLAIMVAYTTAGIALIAGA